MFQLETSFIAPRYLSLGSTDTGNIYVSFSCLRCICFGLNEYYIKFHCYPEGKRQTKSPLQITQRRVRGTCSEHLEVILTIWKTKNSKELLISSIQNPRFRYKLVEVFTSSIK